MKARTIDVGGLVHYADFGGEGPRTLVLVHGLGGSHLNWLSVGASLTRFGRVVAPDLAGFGHSPWSPGRSRIGENRALLGRFIRAISKKPVVLVGNSMGGMLSMLQAATDLSTVEALILVCPSLILPPLGTADRQVASLFSVSAVPVLGEWVMNSQRKSVPPERAVRQMMHLCCVDTKRLDEAVIEKHCALARERLGMSWSIPAYLEAMRSLLMQMSTRAGQVDVAMQAVRAPVLLIQGEADRLVPVACSREAARRCPSWTFEVFDDVGHIPMLEAPGRFVASVERWLSSALP